MKEKNVTKEEIKKALIAVGLGKGDTVLVHSSLKSFGRVEGGADTVIDALLETIGGRGTLVMPTFTWDSMHDKEKVVFDILNTPSETGKITEAFRKRKGVTRSTHVCHSVAAMGPNAKDIMGEGRSSFGKGSTFDALYKLNGWNLFLGVTFTSCTVLHMVEEFMNVPYRYHRDFRGSKVILPQGKEIPSQSIEFLRKKGYDSEFEKIEQILYGEGILKISTAGEAKIINARVREIFGIINKYMEKDIYFLVRKTTI